ncbi:hypothetical protein GQ457_12G010710 [Hibiscus cannabinus]
MCRLRSLKKGTLSMNDFASQVQEICDLLANYGNPISKIEQVATVLNGLPSEFEPTVAVISGSKEPYTFDAAVSLLVDAEVRNNDPLRLLVGINHTTFKSSGRRGGSRSYNGGKYKGRYKP